MTITLKKLTEAETQALRLFKAIEDQHLVVSGKSERQLNNEVFQLAEELLGIKKYWHKRIVRAGKNTLLPYKENPPDLILKQNDIVFFKSKKSDRWWMQVPYPSSSNSKYERHLLVPCSYTTYEVALTDEMPDQWWLTYKKLII